MELLHLMLKWSEVVVFVCVLLILGIFFGVAHHDRQACEEYGYVGSHTSLGLHTVCVTQDQSTVPLWKVVEDNHRG